MVIGNYESGAGMDNLSRRILILNLAILVFEIFFNALSGLIALL